ncbi:MAG TPA: histidine phosphatase family protein [Methylocystis sp.]|nr:histidine phosphatase family protein [Methylocystis sp.]
MTIRLHLLCSASTASVCGVAFPKDEPVDPLGRKGLFKLSGRLPTYDRILRSPARCAEQTAEGLALDADSEPALRDCNFGRWTGRALEELHAREPDALEEWLRNPAAAPHGGESFTDVMKRVGGWMDALQAQSRSILAITHAAVIRAAIANALDATPSSILRIDVSPLGFAKLSGGKGRWRLSALVPSKHLR